jgi:TP901 family phage tail tape measure protein
MARNVGYTMTFTFKGVDQLSPAAQSAERSTRRMGDAIKQTSDQGRAGLQALAGAYNALIVAQRAAQWMAAAIKPAMDMENAATRLKVATGLSADQVTRLEKAARKAASVTPFAPAEAVEAATRLNMALRDVEGTAAALTPTMSIATTYLEGDFNRAALMSSRIVGGFRLQATELAGKLDELAVISRVVGTPVARMDEGFKKLGEAANFSGQSFKELVGMLALAVRGGTEASRATTGMRTGLLRLARARVQKEFQAQGISAFDAAGQYKSLSTILLDLARVQERMSTEEFSRFMDKVFGARAVGPWITAVGQLRAGLPQAEGGALRMGEAFAKINSELKGADGTLTRMTEEAMMPLEQQIKLLRESIGILLETAFRPMLEFVTPIVSKIKEFALGFKTWLEAHPVIHAVLTAVAKFAGVLMSALTVIFAIAAAARVLGAAFMFLGQTAAAGGLAGRLAGLVVGLKTTQAAIWSNFRAAQAMDAQWYTSMQVQGVARTSTLLTARAMSTMKNAMYAAGASVRALARSFAPLIILQGVLSWLELFGVDVFGGGGGEIDVNKMMKDLEKAGKMAVKQQVVEKAIMKDFGHTVDRLADGIKEWTKLQKLKFPIPSFEGLRQMGQLVPLIAKAPGVGEKGLQQMNNWMALVTRVQRQMADPKTKVKADDLMKAQFAAGQLMNLVKMFQPTNKRLIESLGNMGKTFGVGAQGSEEFKKTLEAIHFKENELVEAQQKQIDATSKEVEARRALLNLQKQNLAAFIMMSKTAESDKLQKALQAAGGDLSKIPVWRLMAGARMAGARTAEVGTAAERVARLQKVVDELTPVIRTGKGGEIVKSDILPWLGKTISGGVQTQRMQAKEALRVAQQLLDHEKSLVRDSATLTGNTAQTEKALGELKTKLDDQNKVMARITAPVVPIAGAVRPGTTGTTAGGPAQDLNKIANATNETAKLLKQKQKVTFAGPNLKIGDTQLPLLAEEVVKAARGGKRAGEGLK